MAKITIIDGNSLLFRAYFATAYPGMEIMRNQDGVPTNAIFAFSNMMNKIVSSLKKEESIIVAFDAAKHNFRHDALETYKANLQIGQNNANLNVSQAQGQINILSQQNIFLYQGHSTLSSCYPVF